MLVSGEAGIGKSRLVEELRHDAAARGVATSVGRCHEGDGAPAFWPWTQILRGLARGEDPARLFGSALGDVAHVVPELAVPGVRASGPLPSDAGDARFRVFAAVGEGLRSAACVAPRLVVVEDLHWADVPSLLLLHFLAREIHDAQLFLVATHRELTGEHPLARPLAALAREPATRRVALGGLEVGEVAALVGAVTGGAPADALCHELVRRTGGNPFFVGDLLRYATRAGGLDHLAPASPCRCFPR